MNKRLSLILATGFCGLVALASPKVNLVVNQSGETKAYDIENIEKINFDGRTMLIHHTEGVSEYEIGDIDDMTFDIVSGIDQTVAEDLDGLRISLDRGLLVATTDADEVVAMTIYDLNGRVIARAQDCGELTYSLRDFAKGIYIVTVNNKVIKFTR